MPNSPAKNISSLASHTITPTLTMFGRFSVWILVLIAEGPGGLVAVVTDGLWTASTIMRLRAASAGRDLGGSITQVNGGSASTALSKLR